MYLLSVHLGGGGIELGLELHEGVGLVADLVFQSCTLRPLTVKVNLKTATILQ